MQTDVEKRIKNVAFQFNKMVDLLDKISFKLDDCNDSIVEYNTILDELWNSDIISGDFRKRNRKELYYAEED